jgi:hypothetical protein
MTHRFTVMACILCVGLFLMSCEERALVEDTSLLETESPVSLDHNQTAQLFFYVGHHCTNLFNISKDRPLGDAEDLCHFSFQDKTYDENRQEMISLASAYCRGVPDKSAIMPESDDVSPSQEMFKQLFCQNYKWLREQE